MGSDTRDSEKTAKLSAVAIASWASLVIAWLSWVICLSGLAAVQQACGGAELNYLGAGVSSLANSLLSCSRFFSYQWFTLFYQLVLLGLVTACAFSTRVFLALRTPLLPFFSVAIVLGLQGADTFVKLYETSGVEGSTRARVGTAFAGFVMQTVVMCLLVIAFGASFEYEDRETWFNNQMAAAARGAAAGNGRSGGVPAGTAAVPEQQQHQPHTSVAVEDPGDNDDEL